MGESASGAFFRLQTRNCIMPNFGHFDREGYNLPIQSAIIQSSVFNGNRQFDSELDHALTQTPEPQQLLELQRKWLMLPAPQRDADAPAAKLLALGHALESHGLWQQALELYSTLTAGPVVAPGTVAEISLRCGLIHERVGNDAQAELSYRDATAYDPKAAIAAAAQYHLAGVLIRRQNAAEAAEILSRLEADTHPDLHGAAVQARLASALLTANKRVLASEVACRLLEDHPADGLDPVSCNGMAALGLELELSGEPALARKIYEAILNGPSVPEAIRANTHLRLGILFDDMGNSTKAIQHYRVSAAADVLPPHLRAESLYRLGGAYFVSEEFEEAIQTLQLLFQAPHLPSPEKAASKLLFARCLLGQGQINEAREALEESRGEYFPREGEALFQCESLLSEICELLGEFERACEALQRAAEAVQGESSLRGIALLAESQLRKRARKHKR